MPGALRRCAALARSVMAEGRAPQFACGPVVLAGGEGERPHLPAFADSRGGAEEVEAAHVASVAARGSAPTALRSPAPRCVPKTREDAAPPAELLTPQQLAELCQVPLAAVTQPRPTSLGSTSSAGTTWGPGPASSNSAGTRVTRAARSTGGSPSRPEAGREHHRRRGGRAAPHRPPRPAPCSRPAARHRPVRRRASCPSSPAASPSSTTPPASTATGAPSAASSSPGADRRRRRRRRRPKDARGHRPVHLPRKYVFRLAPLAGSQRFSLRTSRNAGSAAGVAAAALGLQRVLGVEQRERVVGRQLVEGLLLPLELAGQCGGHGGVRSLVVTAHRRGAAR